MKRGVESLKAEAQNAPIILSANQTASMTSIISNKSSKTISSQETTFSSQSKFSLDQLPSELLMKVANLASESISELRLTCPQIESSLREATKKATLKVQGEIAPFSLTYLSPHRFSELRKINLEHYSRCFAPLDSKVFPLYPNIQKIRIDQPKFVKDAFIDLLSRLTLLRVLKFGDCSNITGAGWKSLLSNSSNFQKMRLENFDLTNIPKLRSPDLSKLVNFEVNDIRGSKDQFLVQILKSALQLRKLKIESRSHITDRLFANILSNKLISINLRFYDAPKGFELRLDPAVFRNFLERNQALREFCLENLSSCCLFSNAQNVELRDFHFPNLRIFKLKGIDMLEMSWVICYATHLEELSLQDCLNFDRHLEEPVKGIPNLKVLELFSCKNIADEAVWMLTLNAKKLTKICIGECETITGRVWSKIQLANLQEFYFECYPQDPPTFSISDLGNLARAAPNLRHLHVCNSQEWEEDVLNEDENLGDLKAIFQKLESFSLAYFKDFTNFGLLYLLARASKLEEITLTHLEKITNSIVPQLIFNCPKIKKIVFDQCDKIDGNVLESSNRGSVLIEYWPIIFA